MLFAKRLLTALLLLATIFLTLYVTALALGEHRAETQAIADVPANLRAFHHERVVARQAKETFDRQYKQGIGLGALGVAAAVSIWLTFGGVLSWCQERALPPLPENMRYGGGHNEPYRRRR